MPVESSPRSVVFGRVYSTGSANPPTRKVNIINNQSAPLNPVLGDVAHENIEAELKAIEPGQKYELTVRLVGKLQPGGLSDRISIQTGVSELAELQVPVSAYVTQPIAVLPKELRLSPNRPKSTTHRFHIRHYGSEPFSVTSMTSSNPAIEVELTAQVRDKSATDRASAFLVQVTVPADYQPPLNKGDRVVIHTDDSAVPVVSIPILPAAAQTSLSGQRPGAAAAPSRATRPQPATAKTAERSRRLRKAAQIRQDKQAAPAGQQEE